MTFTEIVFSCIILLLSLCICYFGKQIYKVKAAYVKTDLRNHELASQLALYEDDFVLRLKILCGKTLTDNSDYIEYSSFSEDQVKEVKRAYNHWLNYHE